MTKSYLNYERNAATRMQVIYKPNMIRYDMTRFRKRFFEGTSFSSRQICLRKKIKKLDIIDVFYFIGNRCLNIIYCKVYF